MSGNIGNTVSLDPLYRGLVILLGWLLPRLAPNRLITTSTLSWFLLSNLLQYYYSYLVNYSCGY